ncbi:MAG: P-II family nitrogen regulator [Clostridiales bacterium]|nr:P-II family nitrogen regulator [Clostridiales bacterium]
MKKYEAVFVIVNAGFSDAVMEAAREAGVTGGTVLNARGTANPQAERFFGLTIEPNKDMIMILIDSEIKEKVLHTLYREVGLKTACQGIAFTLPVNDVVGLTPPRKVEQPEETKAAEEATDQAQEEIVLEEIAETIQGE